MRVIWYNINGIKGKANDVVSLMENEEIDVLMLQEASGINDEWFQRLSRKLSRINCVLICDVPNSHLATIVRTKQVQTYGVLLSKERLQVIKVVTENTTVTLANHYGPHRKDLTHYKWLEETISMYSLTGKFALGGDHNAVTKETDRTARRLDSNSLLLVEALTNNNMSKTNGTLINSASYGHTP